MHMCQRQIKIHGRGMVYKTPIQGAQNRETNAVRAEVVQTGAKHYAENVTMG